MVHASPVAALAAAADGERAILVVDQLDAVSLASGRMPQSYAAVADVLQEARAFPNITVLLACRAFDVENDHRLRALISDRGPASAFTVGPLEDAQVRHAVEAMALPADRLTERQIDLLHSPLNLVLLNAVADQTDALNFESTRELFDAFWSRKRPRSPEPASAAAPVYRSHLRSHE